MKCIKKIPPLTTAIFFLLLSMSAHAEPLTGKEYQAIVETAYNYFNGAAKGDQSLLEKAFDLEFGHVKSINIDKESGKETIRSIPLKEFSGFFTETVKETWKAKILSIDIVDDRMAMVKLDFDTPKMHYIDYLVMYKRDSDWRIVNKTFISKKK